MTRITPEHLVRDAVVYVRQSSAFQVTHNLESQRRQYALTDRAKQLGWADVEVIDEDLGRSGGGARRPGFEKLLAGICEGRIGAVFSLEASRLARNGRDWHTLLEFCGIVGTLIVDEEGVYDPTSPNDRLLLGMKGTMSEMEVSVFRQRSREAIRQKARRGELFLTLAVGYVKHDDRVEKDADRRVQDAINLVFRKFTEFQSIRQVLVWFRQEQIRLPFARQGKDVDRIEWRLPVYSTLRHILTNPVYAGAYAFGRRAGRVAIEEGQKRVVRTMRRDSGEWEVLIRDHHDGYISWDDFDRNQKIIADNANGKRYMSRGAVRSGEALLPGLFRCGKCGKKLHIRYGQGHRYVCNGNFTHLAAALCISFGGVRVDRAVAAEVLQHLQPLGVEAALQAIDAHGQQRSDKRAQLETTLQQARYEALRAQRQYDATDPDNRLVAGELERRWNQRLNDVAKLESELESLAGVSQPTLSDADRTRLMALGQDLTRAWDSPGATIETRKKIIRTVVEEIIVDVVDDTLALVIHWRGGDHSRLTVKKNRVGQNRYTIDHDVIDLVRVLARQMPDQTIAAVLNRSGKTTPHGKGWTRASVCSLRNRNKVAIYQDGERSERGEATLDEAATALGVSPSTIRRLILDGTIPAAQHCPGAPWIIQHADLERDDIRRKAEQRRSRRPASDSRQENWLDKSTT